MYFYPIQGLNIDLLTAWNQPPIQILLNLYQWERSIEFRLLVMDTNTTQRIAVVHATLHSCEGHQHNTEDSSGTRPYTRVSYGHRHNTEDSSGTRPYTRVSCSIHMVKLKFECLNDKFMKLVSRKIFS